MGLLTSTSESLFSQPAAQVYDFVTNPENWPLTYPGSTGVEGLRTPLKVGDTWSETALLDGLDCRFDWIVTSAQRPRLWEFQSLGRLAQNRDGSGGFDGVHTVTYEFLDPGDGLTLFRRRMSMRMPRHGRMHRSILLAYDPVNTDRYHEAVATYL
jgi:hypothetical protein